MTCAQPHSTPAGDQPSPGHPWASAYGRGAGPHPTASAIIADLVDIAKAGAEGPAEDHFMVRALGKRISVKSIFSILSRYYLRLNVIDKPSVLANISRILGRYRVSISDVIQRERSAGAKHDVRQSRSVRADD